MLVVMKPGTPQSEVEKVQERLEQMKVEITLIEGAQQDVFALVGDTTKLDLEPIRPIRSLIL